MKDMSMRPQAIVSRRLAVAGLFEMLEKKKYADITISDICTQGGISRQTFYRNFDYKEDIIAYYIHHVVEQHMQKVTGNMNEDLQSFFCHLPFSPEFLTLLRDNNLIYLMRDSVIPLIDSFLKSSKFQAGNTIKNYEAYYSRYIADTMVSILETWASRDFKENDNQLYEIMRMLLQGVK